MPCDIKNNEDSGDDVYGPVLPPKINREETKEESKPIIGPVLPSSLKQQEDKTETTNEEEDFFGPALPPHLLKKRKAEDDDNENVTVKRLQVFDEKTSNENDSDDNDDDDDIVGPLPADCASSSNSFVQKKLEERAWRLKNDFLKKDAPVEKKREEWMLELPPAHTVANFGLGPRKFKTREGPDMSDRSIWTDTPADREKKRLDKLNKVSYNDCHKEKKKSKERSRSDHEEKKSKRKEKSLLELHQEKLRKEQKKKEKEAKESGRTLRRPFDRDIDLKIGGLSEKDKKSIFAKSKLLDDKFCHAKM